MSAAAMIYAARCGYMEESLRAILESLDRAAEVDEPALVRAHALDARTIARRAIAWTLAQEPAR